MDTQSRFLTEYEVSRLIGFKLPTLRNWRFLRKGPRYRKIGRSVRYAIEDVMQFMNSIKVETKAMEE